MWYGVLCCGMVFYALVWCFMLLYGVLSGVVWYGIVLRLVSVWCFMLLYGVLSGVVWYCVKTPGFCDHSSSFA